MMSNANCLSRWRLYVIIDVSCAGARDLSRLTEEAIRGGADAIQLRDKRSPTRAVLQRARDLHRITQPAGVPLIINDRLDIALAVGAEGVHVGQDDLPVAAAKALLGRGRIVGQSTHSLEQALQAQQEGADYIAVGPVYPTPTKPDASHVGLPLITTVKARVKAPMVCIGGIDHGTLPAVLAAGAPCVAVVRAVCGADHPEAAARRLKDILTQFFHEPSPSSL